MNIRIKSIVLMLLCGGISATMHSMGLTASERVTRLREDSTVERLNRDQCRAALRATDLSPLERLRAEDAFKRSEERLGIIEDYLKKANAESMPPAKPGFASWALSQPLNHPGKTILGLMIAHGIYLNANDVVAKGWKLYDVRRRDAGDTTLNLGLSLAFDIVARGPRASFITLVNAKNGFAKWRSDTYKWMFPPKPDKPELGDLVRPRATLNMTVAEFEAKTRADKARAAAELQP